MIGFERTLRKLLVAGKNVVVVIDTPEIMINPRKCMRNPQSDVFCSFNKADVLKRQQFFRDFVADMKAKYPSIEVFDPVPVLCPGDRCYIHDDNYLNYRDLSHISERSSNEIGVRLKSVLGSSARNRGQ